MAIDQPTMRRLSAYRQRDRLEQPERAVARAVYLQQIPQFRRQVRVLGDWTFALLFRRDIVAFIQAARPPLVDEDASVSGRGQT